MIGLAVPHGRTKQDAQTLAAYLLKDAGARVELYNSVAPDLHEIMSDMLLFRDASRADAAFLHMFISPARDMSNSELRKAAEIAIRHFGAEEHPYALVIHEKERTGGKGNRHVHGVVGRVGPKGQIIKPGFEKIRMEAAMRIAEYELGEPCVLGRYHASNVKWLRDHGRDDVADYMVAAFGTNPERPQTTVSAANRNRMQRLGFHAGTVIATVQDAWTKSDNAVTFIAALSDAGLSIIPGLKPDVFIVASKGGVELMALERILKEDRGVIAAKLKHLNLAKALQAATFPAALPLLRRPRALSTQTPEKRAFGWWQGGR